MREPQNANGPVIGRRGGTISRERWCFMQPFQVGRHFDRLRIVQTPLFGIYLHVIHQPDADPDPHDHPWGFWSLVLCGGYLEEVWDLPPVPQFARVAAHRRFSLHRMRRSAAHRIIEVRGLLWTLVLVGPRRREWGWWADGEFVDWKTYRGIEDPGKVLAERNALWGS